MKKALYVVFFIAFAMPITGHTQSTEKKIIGTWLFDDERSFKNLPKETQVHFDTITRAQVKQMKSLYVGRTIAFKNNGSFIQKLSDGRSVEGRWNFDSETHIVTITHPQGGKFQQNVQITPKNRLLLIPLESGNVKMFINQWYFTKL